MKQSILLNLFAAILVPTAFSPAQAQDDLVYVAVEPCRIVDTRNAGGAITANTFRNFRVSGTVGELAVQGGESDCLDPKAATGLKPSAISAYVLAVPATSSTGGGVLTAYPSDQLPPAVGKGSTVNFAAGQVIGNTTNITLCDPAACATDGEFSILARSTDQHVVIDVQGYFYPLLIEGTCSANASTRFVDNGDGTICDTQTGLMWEKKDAEDGVNDLSNPNDVDNNYTWTTTDDGDNTDPDGTVFTDFLARLNNTVASRASDTPFAGHTDWRIPTIAELRTILDFSFCGSLCIDPFFGPTAAAIYWSSTSSARGRPNLAWSVNFFTGNQFINVKSNDERVRAVRGGR